MAPYIGNCNFFPSVFVMAISTILVVRTSNYNPAFVLVGSTVIATNILADCGRNNKIIKQNEHITTGNVQLLVQCLSLCRFCSRVSMWHCICASCGIGNRLPSPSLIEKDKSGALRLFRCKYLKRAGQRIQKTILVTGALTQLVALTWNDECFNFNCYQCQNRKD